MPIYKEIVFPQFLEASVHAIDPFWKSVFENLAYEKCPYGIYFSKGFLCCSFKGKEFVYKIEQKDPDVLYNEVHELLHTKANINSSNDHYKLIKCFEEIEKELKDIKNSNWTSIKKKSIKDNIIENFIIDMKNTYNLSLSVCKELNSVIQLGLIFKTITHKDIVYEDGKIKSISGILFKDNAFELRKDLFEYDSVSVYEKTTDEKYYFKDFVR
jgi:hypothetical protein